LIDDEVRGIAECVDGKAAEGRRGGIALEDFEQGDILLAGLESAPDCHGDLPCSFGAFGQREGFFDFPADHG
jgi:hypothetical protein